MNKKEKEILLNNYHIKMICDGGRFLDPNYRQISIRFLVCAEKSKKIKNIIADCVEYEMLLEIDLKDFSNDNIGNNFNGGIYSHSMNYFELLKDFKLDNKIINFEKKRYKNFYDFILKTSKNILIISLSEIKNPEMVKKFIKLQYEKIENNIRNLKNDSLEIISDYDLAMAKDVLSKDEIKINYMKLQEKIPEQENVIISKNKI